jgi:hypothetical protein
VDMCSNTSEPSERLEWQPFGRSQAWSLTITFLALALGAPARAQEPPHPAESIAVAARNVREQKSNSIKHSKVITNDDLRGQYSVPSASHLVQSPHRRAEPNHQSHRRQTAIILPARESKRSCKLSGPFSLATAVADLRHSHSYRNATSGSTLAARLAGSRQAASPVITTSATTAPNVHGSVADTPQIWLFRKRVSP